MVAKFDWLDGGCSVRIAPQAGRAALQGFHGGPEIHAAWEEPGVGTEPGAKTRTVLSWV